MDEYIFNDWAQNGKSEIMETNHKSPILKFLQNLEIVTQFTLLDIGCGNGWFVREISKLNECNMAIGIDNSKKMIENAQSKKRSQKENYVFGDINKYNFDLKFDYVFSMESLYYILPMEKTLFKIYSLLRSGGIFVCGTDFYNENKSSTNWPKLMKMKMDLRSKKDWYKMFQKVGFKTRISQIIDKQSNEEWKKKIGTLFVYGTK